MVKILQDNGNGLELIYTPDDIDFESFSADILIYEKAEVDTLITAATAVDASTTVKGIVEEATQIEMDAGTDTGATGARLFAVPSKIIAWAATIYQTIITNLAINKGGTNSTAALNNNRVMQSSGGAIVEATAITAAKALKSDANGIPVHFDTTTEPSITELQYVKGVTSAIQTQLDKKGYVIKVGHASITYADSTTYFFGAMMGHTVPIATTPDDRRSFTAFETGTIDKLILYIVANSGSNTEVVTIKIHNSTAATTTAALGTLDLSSTGGLFRWIFTGIAFAVTSGDKLHIQIDVPVYVTNPTIIMVGDVFLKPS